MAQRKPSKLPATPQLTPARPLAATPPSAPRRASTSPFTTRKKPARKSPTSSSTCNCGLVYPERSRRARPRVLNWHSCCSGGSSASFAVRPAGQTRDLAFVGARYIVPVFVLAGLAPPAHRLLSRVLSLL